MGFLWLAGLGLSMAGFQAPEAAKAPDFPAEYAALVREFNAAQHAYYEPYSKAKTDEERSRIVLDPAKEPSIVFVARFQDLARRAKGTDTGARSLFWVVTNTNQPGSDVVSDSLDDLMDNYLDSPVLADLAQWLPQGSRAIGTPRTRELLEFLSEKPKLADVRANALFSLASMLYDDGSNDEALATFRRLQKDFGGTSAAARAANYLFEIEHLQIGMTAPDFEAVDEKGASYKLSDYRGKVVVIDFWGFW
jgi:hypothetical protein